MHLSTTLVLATALAGAAAHPSAGPRHASLHRVARSNKFVKYVQPASTPSPSADTDSGSGSFYEEKDGGEDENEDTDDEDSSPGEKKDFCAGSKKRATTADISYEGNTGAGDWGCNIMEIDCETLDLYDYTAEFASTGAEYSCSVFNKIGPTGDVDGFWHSALDFSVKDKVCLAFEADSQGGVACGEGSDGPPKTEMGQLAGTWAEFDFGSGTNGGESGADVSTIVADAAGMKDIIAMAIEAPGKGVCSRLSLEDPGKSVEVYRGGMEDDDGVGCKGYSKGCINVTLGD